MEDKETTVIGYFAASKSGNVACDGPACIVAGSYKKMKEYLETSKKKSPTRMKMKIAKTRFGEIVSGLNMGGSYSFDEESYCRFAPLAKEIGIDCGDHDFTSDSESDIKFFTLHPL